jgi:hypothetical protein
MITFGVLIGEEDNETNNGQQIFSRSGDHGQFRLRGEHFFESDFGFLASGYLGASDEITNEATNSIRTTEHAGLFLAAAYRATMSRSFRMPVRFGPFLQSFSIENETLGQQDETEYSTWGLRLSAEPEYIIFQSESGRRVSELSAFCELSCGAGQTKYDAKRDPDPALVGEEDGYAFTFSYEVGLRYRTSVGAMVAVSWYAQKYHIGTSESYDNIVFFGVDNDITGVMLTVGYRF